MKISRMRPSVKKKGVVIIIMIMICMATIVVGRWIETNVRSATILVQNDSLDTSLAEDHRQLDWFIQDLS